VKDKGGVRMKLNAGFIFLAQGANYQTDRQVVSTPSVDLTVVGVANYEDACVAAKQMEELGIGAIELCGGFGIIGTAKVKEAVSKNVVVGVVRFDLHPGLSHQSGDELF
jgi:hypothetical protein